jgi:pilus assembly protein CpaE
VAEAEARILWATHAAAGSPERALVAKVAAELRVTALVCPHSELSNEVRPGRFDLIGIELGTEPRDGIALIRQLHERFPRMTIVAALPDSGVAILRMALEAGATDVVSLPLSEHELQRALVKFRQTRVRDATEKGFAGEVITLYGVRGGLGVTTLAVNLAVQLGALTSTSVALVDLDLQRGDVATFLNLNPLESIAAIGAAPGEVDEIFLHGMLTRHASGVSVLAAPQQIEEAESVGHDEVKLALGLLRSQFRYTVIDTPRTISGSILPAFEHSDHTLVVTDLSIPSMRATRRFLDLLGRLNVPNEQIGIVLTELVPAPVEVKDAVRSLGKLPIVTVPRDDAAASKAMNSGTPLNGGRPAGLALAVNQLATKLGNVEPSARGRGGFLRRLLGKEATA